MTKNFIHSCRIVLLTVFAASMVSFATDPQDQQYGLPIDKKNSFIFESGFGQRQHPVLGTVRMHTGIDLTAGEGIPVVAAQSGEVVKATTEEAYGNIIVIRHADGYSTLYAHLKQMNVKSGDKVIKGQQIGEVGHTGLSQRNHLHFELLKDGTAIDPLEFLPELK